MSTVKKIELILENCEVLEFEPKFFYECTIEDIKEKVRRNACNSISKIKSARLIMLAINKEADDINKPFGMELEDPDTIFERLTKYNDITSICITFEDGIEERYFVDYDEGDKKGVLGAPNINQDSFINEYGHLFLTICADKKLKDLFNENDLKEDFTHWLLYN